MSNFLEPLGKGVDEARLAFRPDTLTIVVADRVVNYTLAAGDAGRRVLVGTEAAGSVTVPANAQVPFPVGTVVAIRRSGSGRVSVAGASGVTINAEPLASIDPRYAEGLSVLLRKTATDTWSRLGDMTIA